MTPRARELRSNRRPPGVSEPEGRLELLLEASELLAESLDHATIVRELAEFLVPRVADWCVVDIVDGSGALRTAALVHSDPAKVERGLEMREKYPPRPEDPVQRVVRTGRAELFADLSAADIERAARDAGHHAALQELGVHAAMFVPLKVGLRTIGVLSLVATEPDRVYDEPWLRVAEKVASRAALALDNARLYHAERKANERLALLAHVSRELASSLDYETTLRNVVALALPALGDFGFFDVVEGDDVRRIALAHDDPETQAIIDHTKWERSTRDDKNLCALSSGRTGLHAYIDEAWMRDIAVAPQHLDAMKKLAFVSMLTVPLSSRGEAIGALTLFFSRSGRHHDLDDQTLAEELANRAAVAVDNARLFKRVEEALRLRDDFLSIAGHELNTPLTTLKIQIGNLLRTAGDPQKLTPKLESADRQVSRLTKLVSQLLDVARIAASRMELEPEPVDLAEITREVIARAADDVRRAGVEIRLDVPPSMPATWDRLRMEQVMQNLVANAIKYGEGQPIDVTLQAIGDDRVRFTVKDRGIGIAPEHHARIFDRFERAVAVRHFGGFGLGLWIVRQILESANGTIAVESEAGKGSTFIVDVPRAIV